MKTLYVDCSMGAAGDMLTAALLELHPHPDEFIELFNKIGIPNVLFTEEKTLKLGISGTRVKVLVNGEEEKTEDLDFQANKHASSRHSLPSAKISDSHAHNHSHYLYNDIISIIHSLDIPEEVRDNALAVYRLLAQAEADSHGISLEEVHFHEVGAMDAIADVTAVCLLLHEISPDIILASPINVGSGYVHCSHGILPVPAPATAFLLKNIPVYSAVVKGELCTPTGAALLRHFVKEYREMPLLSIAKIGCGMGTKDFTDAPNCLRIFLTEEDAVSKQDAPSDIILELQCNLDDMTPEELGFAMDILQKVGALDTFFTPIQMKKNRPAVLLSCLCKREDKEKIIRTLFKYTTTLGIREILCRRSILRREEKTKLTKFGEMRCKTASGYGVTRNKWEYEDLVRAAKENGLSLEAVKAQL